MQRLHIPLSRHSATTRRHRRVVWLLGVLLILVGLSGWDVSAAWFSRDLTFKATPLDTAIRLRLFVNRGTWEDLDRLFSATPLISNRSITLKDLQPFISGECSLFFLSDGSRAVAIHTNNHHLPNPEWLDSVGIVKQEIAPDVLLLSDRLLPLSENPRPVSSLPVHFLAKQIGLIRFFDGNTDYSGRIEWHKDRIVLKTNIPAQTTGNIVSADGMMGAMSTPALSDVGINGLTDSMDVFAKPLGTTGAGWLAGQIENTGAEIALSADKSGLTFVLDIPASALSLEEGTSLIRMLAALQMPITRPWTLPDRTESQEIIIDPALVTVEQQTILGNQAVHASANGRAFDVAVAGNRTFLSNDRSMIEQYIQQKDGQKTSSVCKKGNIFVNIAAISALYDSASQSWSDDVLTILSQNVSSLSITRGFFGKAIVTLCTS